MKIMNIDQLLPAIQDKPEFVVLDKGWFQVIDYVFQQPTTFDTPEAMECRGIKFCKQGLILARPFRKFFNYGEAGTHMNLRKPHTIYEKLDGSMVHAARNPDTGLIYFMTRKGCTDVAKKAERVAMSQPGIVELCHTALRVFDMTPIFEYTGPENRILLRYEDSTLTLLALRHIINGDMLPADGLRSFAKQFRVPIPETVVSSTEDPDTFAAQVRAMQGNEGYVVYFDDGHMVKIKTEDYVIKHRALDDMSSKNKIVILCCQGFMDDVIPILDQADKDELINFNGELQREVTTLAVTVNELAALARKITRKSFALEYVPSLKPKWLGGCVFGVLDGKDARALVLKAVERGGYVDIGVTWRGE